ncbi:MAG: hypothetical protein IPH20_01750 [Bacteroidales bacterium]|nr:hypothetical protein [Bacteroidales bacterium]
MIAQTPYQDSLVYGLVQNDFLIFTDSSKIDSVRQSFIKDGYIFSTEINRYVHIDAEELAEGSFNFFKNDLTKILKKRGLEITFSTTGNFEKLHEVMINNRRFNLYDDKNLADFSFWDIGSRRFFNAINLELEKSKSNERFYLLYGGNDLGAILLTDEQFELIEKINEGNAKEIPYKP